MIQTKFKDTEVGRIPDDWNLDRLRDCFEFKPNNTFSRDTLSESGEIQNVHYGDVLIKYGPHLDAQKDLIPYVANPNYKAQDYISDGDVIVADTAEDETVGKATEVINVKKKKIVSGLHTMWLHPIVGKQYALGYLGYAFNASVYHNQLLPLMQGTKVTSVSKLAIKDTYILVPPIAEQQRIAKALSDIDLLIMQLGKLIEKKRAIKQGAMQQLLTGKKQLKGFSEPWEEKKLGELCKLFGRIGFRGYTKQDLVEKGKGAITFSPSDIHNQKIDYSNCDYISFAKYEESPEIKVFNGDIIFAKTASIGKCSIIEELREKATINPQFVVLKEFSCNNIFLYYKLIDKDFQTNVWSICGGSTIPTMSQEKLKLQTLIIPTNIEEQTAIAAVLSSMDEEISALEAKRDKYTAIKQGMMQQLLTGKIRLVENAVKTNVTSANVHFRRSVLAAEIADRLCEEPTFGHVKMEKILFLSERLCHIETGSHYHRDAAGPYDNRALRSIDSQLKKQKWFEVRRTEKGYRYVPMQNRGKHKMYFDKYFSAVLPTFEKIIDTFKTQNTERCEIVATLYSAWEDLLHSNKPFTDADIVNDVLNNWHESKKRISKERWLHAIQWMRENDFAPNVRNE